MAEIKLKADAMKVQDEALMAAGYSRAYEGRGTWVYTHKEKPFIYKRTFIMREKCYRFEYPDPINTKQGLVIQGIETNASNVRVEGSNPSEISIF